MAAASSLLLENIPPLDRPIVARLMAQHLTSLAEVLQETLEQVGLEPTRLDDWTPSQSRSTPYAPVQAFEHGCGHLDERSASECAPRTTGMRPSS